MDSKTVLATLNNREEQSFRQARSQVRELITAYAEAEKTLNGLEATKKALDDSIAGLQRTEAEA